MTPYTVIGGYLGAGKTTLIRHLVEHPEGQRLGLLINDFGAINIDAA
ncbi:MAG: GTP-binding protein, partial [Pseudomonadales bacterium]